MIRNGLFVRFFMLCVLVMVCTGCPQRYVSRTVVLSVGATGGRDSQKLTVEHSEVQSAIKIVDEILVSHGFTLFAPEHSDVSLAKTYLKIRADGLMQIYPAANIILEEERLVFAIGGRGNLSAESKRIFKEIRAELREHYGAERIRGR